MLELNEKKTYVEVKISCNYENLYRKILILHYGVEV